MSNETHDINDTHYTAKLQENNDWAKGCLAIPSMGPDWERKFIKKFYEQRNKK
jgi:hypothetical protein